MLLDRPKEELARDLREQAVKFYGPERAEELEKEIDRVVGWLALIAALIAGAILISLFVTGLGAIGGL